jgi:hypothetical protein
MRPVKIPGKTAELNVVVNALTPSISANGYKYYDQRLVQDDELAKHLLRGNIPVRFDWENKWLRGD